MLEFRNLFTGIVKDENDVTELLVNMMQHKFFRDICLRWLLKEFIACPRTIESLINEIEAKDIKTQYNTLLGRPDIVIENEQCFFIIENKRKNSTQSTEDQRKLYPGIVNGKSKPYSGIIFLVPRDYQLELDKEVYKTVNWRELHWDDLLSYLYKQEVGEVSDCYKDAMIQMETVIDNAIIVDTRLTSYETAMLYSPHQITEIYKRSSKIKEILGNYSNDSLKKSDWNEDKFGIGYFYNNSRKQFIGFGPSVSNPDCFFAYSFESDKPVNGIRSELDKSTGTYWNYYPIKIEDWDNIDSCLTNQINNVVGNNYTVSITDIEDDGVLLKMEMDTRATYSLAEKILELASIFIESKNETVHSLSNDNSEIGGGREMKSQSEVWIRREDRNRERTREDRNRERTRERDGKRKIERERERERDRKSVV